MPDTPEITQAMIRLYDEYTHLTLSRRDFMARLRTLAGSSAAAAAIAPLLAASSAAAAVVAPDDMRVLTMRQDFGTRYGRADGYLARPRGATADLPAVLVVHENRGLNAYIEDVARRLAVEGFVALAPDFLSLEGGTPADEDAAREQIRDLDPGRAVVIASSGVEHLMSRRGTLLKVGAVGFCWGGGLVNRLATEDRDLAAGVSFYGAPPDLDRVGAIRAGMLFHYAELDDRINADVPAFREALDTAGVSYEMHMYDGVNHAFHNDTSAARYDAEAAELAWARTIDFLRLQLS